MNVEERAEENALLECFDKHRSGKYHQGLVEGYITGATEQLDIDIDKACEIVCGMCTNCTRDLNGVCFKKNLIREAMKGE